MVILNEPLPDNSIWKGTRISFVPKRPDSLPSSSAPSDNPPQHDDGETPQEAIP